MTRFRVLLALTVALVAAAGLAGAVRPGPAAAAAADERLLGQLVQAEKDQAAALKDIASELRELGRRCGR